jgi:hypothetical protein
LGAAEIKESERLIEKYLGKITNIFRDKLGITLNTAIYSVGLVWGTPIPTTPVTSPQSFRFFLQGMQGIIIYQEKLQTVGKIVKYITVSAVHILSNRFCSKISRNE